MCFCVFAVGFELLRMQEIHVRGCFTNRVSEFALVAEPAKVIDKPTMFCVQTKCLAHKQSSAPKGTAWIRTSSQECVASSR